MDLKPVNDGPDGSSIKPVSSLLARFENMNQVSGASTPQHQTISQPISPGLKPESLQTSIPPARKIVSRSISPRRGIWKAQDRPIHDGNETRTIRSVPERPHPSRKPIPAAKPQGLMAHRPAVKVQPPLSPSNSHSGARIPGDESPFLDPISTPHRDDRFAYSTASKALSRPISPFSSLNSAVQGTRSAISQPPSQPPSPPPPRRSSEFRREKDVKPSLPSAAPSRDRSAHSRLQPSSLPESRGNHFPVKEKAVKEISPFSSPPSSPGADENLAPPKLPTRPMPKAQPSNLGQTPASKSGGGFEDRPVRHPNFPQKPDQNIGSTDAARGNLGPQKTVFPRSMTSTRLPIKEYSQPSLSKDFIRPPIRMPRPSSNAGASISGVLSTSATSSRKLQQPAAHHVPAPPVRKAFSGKSRDSKPESFRSKELENPAENPASSTMIRTMPVQSYSTSVKDPSNPEPIAQISTFPDAANANRRPPFVKRGCSEIETKYDPKFFDVCGELVCTSGQLTRVWSLLDGEQLMSLSHTEGVKATSISFKPAPDADEEGKFLWVGTNVGELLEVEIATHCIKQSKSGVHGRCEVSRIYRHRNELWTCDEGGTLHIWGPDPGGTPNLNSHPHQTYKLPRGHTFSIVVDDDLWYATGKSIRVFSPAVDASRAFQALMRPLLVEGAGEISAGAQVRAHPEKVFFGHVDGKISIHSTTDFTLLAVLSISPWKIQAMAGSGQYIWAGYSTGKICVYDLSETPWVTKKEWHAHEQPVFRMKADPASAYRLDRLQIMSLSTDGKLKIWDGLLQDDWLEEELKSRDTQFCEFDEIKAMIMTWNAGASTPHGLRYSGDARFFQDLVESSDSPDIFIFGFQELVDLEDKAATARRFLKSSKRKEGPDQERMSHQYRDWRDFLMKTLDDHTPANDLYHLLQTAPLIGLFSCIFVKASLRERIRNLSAAEVKRGMGGLHGNKGAVAIRFQIDDSSLCFINCHLAAGQTQSSSRHNDIAMILESSMFPAERNAAARIDSYTGGGDGSMIFDHELCVLNGDLNYRIDTMSRDTVVKAVAQKNLAKLLERDQLLVAKRRNPNFRLRAFEELPITFAPTYKYDIGTDNYDTSEKKRSPAWCDRILFRGRGRVQQLDYRGHEVRISDHRPVTGSFRFWVKRVGARERAAVWIDCQQGFENIRQQELAEEKMLYLMNDCGYDETSSREYSYGSHA